MKNVILNLDVYKVIKGTPDNPYIFLCYAMFGNKIICKATHDKFMKIKVSKMAIDCSK